MHHCFDRRQPEAFNSRGEEEAKRPAEDLGELIVINTAQQPDVVRRARAVATIRRQIDIAGDQKIQAHFVEKRCEPNHELGVLILKVASEADHVGPGRGTYQAAIGWRPTV